MGNNGFSWSRQRSEDYAKEIQRLEVERQTSEADRKRKEQVKRENLCQDLVIEMMIVIQEKIIRPGPKPEERQCVDVANELTLIEPELSALVYTRVYGGQ